MHLSSAKWRLLVLGIDVLTSVLAGMSWVSILSRLENTDCIIAGPHCKVSYWWCIIFEYKASKRTDVAPKISYIRDAARFQFRLFQSIWNLTGTSAAALRKCLSNFRAMRSYNEKAWHVFRMALHNEGDWRMETWQRARQGELSCLHTPIPELCNAILNTCQIPSRFYIIPSDVNKSQTHLLKRLQPAILWRAIYAGKTRRCLLWCFFFSCVHVPHARAVTVTVCDRGRTITHMQISRFHTQVWYNYNIHSRSFETSRDLAVRPLSK